MGNITLSMIIKNEEEYLEGCLASIEKIVDEIVIVDTGSTDKSVSIAKKYGAKIYHLDWENDFAAARNYALEKSNGDWILYLDADERLSVNSLDKVKEITSQNKKLGVYCSVKSINEKTGTPNIMKYIRLFKNSSDIKFSGRIHEQIEPSLKQQKYELINSSIEILHLGYNISKESLKKKALRNLRLLNSEYEENKSGYNAFQIGQTYMVLEEYEKAIRFFNEALQDPELEKHHRAHCYRYLAANEEKENNTLAALNFVKEGLKLVDTQPLLNVIASNVYLKLNEIDKAIFYCKRAYEFNSSLLKKEKETYFDILIDEKALALHCINISVLCQSKSLFNYFYPIVVASDINQEGRDQLEFIHTLINNLPAEPILFKNIDEVVKGINFNTLIKLFNNYQRGFDKLVLLTKLSFRYSNNYKFLSLFGKVLIENNQLQKAAEVFSRALSLKNDDPVIIFNLITIYSELKDYEQLREIVNKAENIFNDYPEILVRLISIKEKISAI